SNNQIIIEDEEGEVTERLAPALRIELDREFWEEKIISKQGETELSNANNFQDYFRGLYFKVEAINGNGSMMLLNFGATTANVTLNYSKAVVSETSDARMNATYVMNFSGNRVNFFTNDFSIPLTDGDPINGDEKLYLKGGEGSIALIDLFDGANLDENAGDNMFELFKKDFIKTDVNGNFVRDEKGKVIAKRLVNEANLVFFVDQELTN